MTWDALNIVGRQGVATVFHLSLLIITKNVRNIEKEKDNERERREVGESGGVLLTGWIRIRWVKNNKGSTDISKSQGYEATGVVT